ncbi:MAG: SsrA-binding protein SmpB [Gammaproteobacteria bacterium]|nr:SsrA-binding protein SmpB [Gammaproteobacteria bacterium]
MTKPSQESSASIIALNRKAEHQYFIEKRLEAGLALLGWEVKSLRAGQGQISESYVIIRKGEAELLGSVITPLLSASSHVESEPARTRRVLLHRREIDLLQGLITRKGYTLIPLRLYWKKGFAKIELGIAKGKKQHDKRATLKEKEWKRHKERLSRKISRSKP